MIIAISLVLVFVLLIACLLSSPFGMFLAPIAPEDMATNASTQASGGSPHLQSSIIQLEEEAKTYAIGLLDAGVDTYTVDVSGIAWSEVISVYIVNAIESPEDYLKVLDGSYEGSMEAVDTPYDQMVMDDAHLQILENTFWDMLNTDITSAGSGELAVRIYSTPAAEMIEYYGYDGPQIGLLYVLLNLDESLWDGFISGDPTS